MNAYEESGKRMKFTASAGADASFNRKRQKNKTS
jgi:hypothetical protein